jgi:hypothetical protein
VVDLSFTVSLDIVEGNALLAETKGIEVTGGCNGARKTETGLGIIRCPSIDRRNGTDWLALQVWERGKVSLLLCLKFKNS